MNASLDSSQKGASKRADSLYADYVFERQGIKALFERDGFVTYKIVQNECFIVDMFVAKESRGSRRFRDMILALSGIAQDAGCDVLSANIHLKAPGAHHALRSAISIGFEVRNGNNDVLLISKSMEEK